MESRSSDSLPHGYRLQGEKNEYVIDRVLGQGAFGITYLARYKASIQGSMGAGSVWAQVAVKEFFMRDMNVREGETGYLSEVSQDSLVGRYRRAFMREARNLASLHHPNIVNVFEVIEANNTVYIVMEYINGGSLDEHIQSKGSLSEDESINSILKVCSAVDLMHSKKILHLDIKPKNIMLDEEGNLYLIDFGLSKQFTPDGEPESSTSIGLGTPGYAPVEQAEHQDGDKQFRATLDIYALGATLFKMLTGNTPPKASQVSDSVIDGNNIISEQLKTAGISEGLIAVVAKAMWPSSRGRYQSVKELVQAINDLNKPVQFKQIVEEDDSTQILTDTVKPKSTPNVDEDQTVIDSLVEKYFPSITQTQDANEKQVKESTPTSSKPSFEITDKEKSNTKIPIIIAIACAIIFIIVAIPKCGSGNTNYPSSSNNKPANTLQESSVLSNTSIIESISLDKRLLGLYEGDSYTFKVSITPSTVASSKKITWTSSDNQIVLVDQSGTIRAVKRGEATITVKCDGMSTSCTVYVNSQQTNIQVTSISLNQTSMTLEPGTSRTLIVRFTPTNATNKAVSWSSSDTKVATVDQYGKVTAIKAGVAGIWANCGGKEAYCTVTVSSSYSQQSSISSTIASAFSTSSGPATVTSNGHEYVDLGLSVNWATCNIGASSPSAYGNYYAWGETSTKSSYSWSTYKYCNGSNTTMTKYCSDKEYGNNGYTDSRTKLELSDDVARQKWGGSWRMPTEKEFQELIDNCTWTWTTMNGVKGYKVTSKKSGYTDRSIFLPAAGCSFDAYLDFVGSYGFYWSSSLYTDYPYGAWYLYFRSDNHYTYYYSRYYGRSVRPVCP